MRKIKVAQVVSGLVLGGGGQVMLTIAKNINRELFHVDFYCVIEGGILVSQIEKLGFKVIVLEAYNYKKIPKYSMSQIIKLSNFFREAQYDIVHTHLFQADVVGRIAGILAKRPIIIKTLHNLGLWKTKTNLLVDKILSYYTDKVVCVSNYQKMLVAKQEGIKQSDIVTIRNGVSVESFQTKKIRRTSYFRVEWIQKK